MQIINFSYNWNKKLDCDSFTSIRLSDRFDIGETVGITLNKRPHQTAIIVGKKVLLLDQINEFIARLDTGYSANECKNIIRTMYSKEVVDWSTQKLYLYLFNTRKIRL